MRSRPVVTAAVAAALLTLALLTLGACSDDTGSAPAETATSSAPTETASASASASGGPSARPKKPRTPGTTVEISIKGGKVTPNGERVKVGVGEPVTLRIDADGPGELHVHSTPEQELEFDKGASTKRLTIDQPGIVDVEEHELEQVIVQLEVS